MKISSVLRSALCALILFSGAANAQKPAVKEVKAESRAAAVQPLRDVYEGIVGSIKNQSLRDDVTTMFSPFFAGQYPSQYAHSLRVFAQQIHADATIKDELKNAIQELTDEVLAVVAVEEKSWWQRRSTLEKASVIGGGVVGAAVIFLLIAQLLKRRAAAKENSFAQLGEEVRKLKVKWSDQVLAAQEGVGALTLARREARGNRGFGSSLEDGDPRRTNGKPEWLQKADRKRAALLAEALLAAQQEERERQEQAERERAALLAAQQEERERQEQAERERAAAEAAERELVLAGLREEVRAETTTLADLQSRVDGLRDDADMLAIVQGAIAEIERKQAEAQAAAQAELEALAAAEEARAAELEELRAWVKVATPEELFEKQQEALRAGDEEMKAVIVRRRVELFRDELAQLSKWASRASLAELKAKKAEAGLGKHRLKVVMPMFLHKLLIELEAVGSKMDGLNQEVGAFEGLADLAAVEALKTRVRALEEECAGLSCTATDMVGAAPELTGQILKLEEKVDSDKFDSLIRYIDDKQATYADTILGRAAITACNAANVVGGAVTVVTDTAKTAVYGDAEYQAEQARLAARAKQLTDLQASVYAAAGDLAALRSIEGKLGEEETDMRAIVNAAIAKQEQVEAVAAFKTALAGSSLEEVWGVVKAQTDPDYEAAAQEVYTASATAALEPIETELTTLKANAQNSRPGYIFGPTIPGKIYPDDRLLSEWDRDIARLKVNGDGFAEKVAELQGQFAEWPKEKFVTGTEEQLAAIAAAATDAKKAYVRSLQAELQDCGNKQTKMDLAERALGALEEKLEEKIAGLRKDAGFFDSATAKLAGTQSAATKKKKVVDLLEEISKLRQLAQGKGKSIANDMARVEEELEDDAVGVEHAKREAYVRDRKIEVDNLSKELAVWRKSGTPQGYYGNWRSSVILPAAVIVTDAGVVATSLSKIAELIREIDFEQDDALETAFDVLGKMLS